jgi:hypothetical protein
MMAAEELGFEGLFIVDIPGSKNFLHTKAVLLSHHDHTKITNPTNPSSGYCGQRVTCEGIQIIIQ